MWIERTELLYSFVINEGCYEFRIVIGPGQSLSYTWNNTCAGLSFGELRMFMEHCGIQHPTSGRNYCCKSLGVFGGTDLGLPFVTGLTIEDVDGVSPTEEYNERPDNNPCDGTRTEGHFAIITVIGAVVVILRTRRVARKSCGLACELACGLASGLVCRLGCGLRCWASSWLRAGGGR